MLIEFSWTLLFYDKSFLYENVYWNKTWHEFYLSYFDKTCDIWLYNYYMTSIFYPLHVGNLFNFFFKVALCTFAKVVTALYLKMSFIMTRDKQSA